MSKVKITELRIEKLKKYDKAIKELFGGPGSGRRPEGGGGNEDGGEKALTAESAQKIVNELKERLKEIWSEQSSIMEKNGLDPIDNPDKLPKEDKEKYDKLQTEKLARGTGLGSAERQLESLKK